MSQATLKSERTRVVDLARQLKQYTLPDGILRLAPSRRLLAAFSDEALAAAVAWTLDYPEKRGIASRAIHAVAGKAMAPLGANAITMEAHFDSVSVPADLADYLLTIGFEPDGFHRFNPEHFGDHFTLKFKCNANARPRRGILWNKMREQIQTLRHALTQRWPDLESYIELEVYPSANRRSWNHSALDPDWEHSFPYPPGVFDAVTPPRTRAESEASQVPLDVTKRADIHIKIAKGNEEERERLIARFEQIGFYRVVTWSGNDVCTGQFKMAATAKTVFDQLVDFFDCWGGCDEITLEPTPGIWRSAHGAGHALRLSAMPPLILGYAEAS